MDYSQIAKISPSALFKHSLGRARTPVAAFFEVGLGVGSLKHWKTRETGVFGRS